MRVIIQRVSQASVVADGQQAGQIGKGLFVLLGICPTDTTDDIAYLTAKIASMRVFSDSAGLMNLSASDVGADILVVSQFTLFAKTRKGNRPSFIDAARPEVAIPLYEAFVSELSHITGRHVPTGVFGADMQISLVADGPVSIIMDSKQKDF